MSIIVLLSPTHFFFNLSFFKLSFINLKTTIFSIQREIIITSLSRKLRAVSTNNFKIDINRISDPLEMCKNIISTKILIYQPVRNFIPCSPEVHYIGPTFMIAKTFGPCQPAKIALADMDCHFFFFLFILFIKSPFHRAWLILFRTPCREMHYCFMLW